MASKQKAALQRDMEALSILAVRAGYLSNMPFGGDKIVPPEMQQNLLRYATALQADLAHTEIENIMLERFVDIAVKHCGHKEVTNFTDMNAMLKSSAMELFYTRFAYQVAHSMKEAK